MYRFEFSLAHSIVIWLLAFSLCAAASVHRFLISAARILMKIWSHADALAGDRRRKRGSHYRCQIKMFVYVGRSSVLKIYTAAPRLRRAAASYCKWIAAKWCLLYTHDTTRRGSCRLTRAAAVCFRTLDLPSEAMHLPMFCFNYAGKLGSNCMMSHLEGRRVEMPEYHTEFVTQTQEADTY